MNKEQQKALALARARLKISKQSRQDNIMNVGEDVAKSTGAGLARGSMDLVGLPGTIGNVLQSGANKLFDLVGMPELTPEQKAQMQSPISGESIRRGANELTDGATEYESKTIPGEYAGTISEFMPGAAAFGGTSLLNLIKFGVLPGASSEAAGQATKDTKYEPYARTAAALAAPLAPTLGRKLVTPNPISPQRAKMAKVLEDEGIVLSAGQKAGKKNLQYAEAELGGITAENFAEAQGKAFTKAVLKKIGVNAREATPEILDAANRRIGRKFDKLITRNNINADRQLVDDLVAVRDEYFNEVAQSNRAPFVENNIRDFANELKNKSQISGKFYQNIRSKLGKRTKMPGPDGEAARNIQNAIDSAMERSMQASGSQDISKWQEARKLWRNYIAIEQAAAGAGEKAALGIISPAQLRNATKTKHGARNYVTGKSDLSALSRAGVAMMTPLPQSGTAPRLIAKGLPMAGDLLAGGAGYSVAGIPGAAAAYVAGKSLPPLAGKLLLSKLGRAVLGNQKFPKGTVGLGQYPSVLSGLSANQSIR